MVKGYERRSLPTATVGERPGASKLLQATAPQISGLSCFTRSLTEFGLIRLEQNWALENMADGSEKLLAKLAALDDSLDDLEEKLEPLLAQTLPESLLPLDTIQQVKLNVAIPYLVYDLIFSTPQSTTTLSRLQTNTLDTW